MASTDKDFDDDRPLSLFAQQIRLVVREMSFQTACETGNLGQVKEFVRRGYGGKTAFESACRANQTKVVDFLYNNCPKIRAEKQPGAVMAAWDAGHFALALELNNLVGPVCPCAISSAFRRACGTNNIQSAELVLERLPPPPTTCGDKKCQASAPVNVQEGFLAACDRGHIDVMEWLHARPGISVTLTDVEAAKYLARACEQKNDRMKAFLLSSFL